MSKIGKREALIIGIDEYLHEEPLDSAVRDAEDVAKILEYNEDKTENFYVKEEFNVETRLELKKLIYDLFLGKDERGRQKSGEVALFYFAGHGFIDYDGAYIVTTEGVKLDMGVSMHEILEMAIQSKYKNKVIILDCCFSGNIGSINIGGKNIDVVQNGITILAASKPNQKSYELDDHGLFTSLLLDALNGGAADIKGNITLSSVYSYINNLLTEKKQRPVFKTNTTNLLSLRKVYPQVKKEVLRQIINYFSTADAEFKLDPSFEPTNKRNGRFWTKEPYFNRRNGRIFLNLQKLANAGLIKPVNEKHMYFAAMKSKSCKLTRLGKYYWNLYNSKKNN